MFQLLYVVASLHILLCPFTKVEESFNIQAAHDILYYQFNLSQYDHNEFPGVVPRTFIGPIIISAISSPVVTILHFFEINKFWMQYVVRLTLALIVIATWSRYRDALQKLFGNTFAWWFTLVTVTQYHFMFYMSRPLPNIMALPFVLFAFEGWLLGHHKQFIVSAGASIIIFRSELAMLFGLLLIINFYFKKIDLIKFFKIVVPAGIALVTLTVFVDSLFWGRLLWPEAEVFWFNTILNKSSNWGTAPFLWYFYSALPRGLGPSVVLLPVGLYLDKRLVSIVAPAIVYVLLFSFLPHKELRFIIYIFPLLNTASAAACSYVYVRRTKSPIYELLFWAICVIILANVVFTITLVFVAMSNYPGGLAITKFHKILKNEPYVHVHISNLAAQTGVTRFTQINDHWAYSKNESLQLDQLQEFTHLLIEAKSKYSPSLKNFTQTHIILDSVETFSHVAVNYKLMPPVKIKMRPALFILEKKNFRDYQRDIYTSDSTVNNEIFEATSTEISMDEMVIKAIDSDNKIVAVVPTKDNDEANSKIDDNIKPTQDFLEERIERNDDEETEKLDEKLEKHDEKETEIKSREIPETLTYKYKRNNDDLKTSRQERKKKAIAKIKSETRKEVVASAKEKLREIMKRHKHIADELSENIVVVNVVENQEDGRGDIPETETALEKDTAIVGDVVVSQSEQEINQKPVVNLTQPEESINQTNEQLDSIVEEVITRLIDRKIYDDKTKPEDIKPEDRQMIQKIVEEVLAEKMNYKRNAEN